MKNRKVATSLWQLGGNSGTTAGVNYLGTADNQPVEFHANGLRALRLETGGASLLAGTSTPFGAPNVIGGSTEHSVASSTVACMIGGGGQYNFIGTNCGSFTIAGEYSNLISNNAGNSFAAGSNVKAATAVLSSGAMTPALV